MNGYRGPRLSPASFLTFMQANGIAEDETKIIKMRMIIILIIESWSKFVYVLKNNSNAPGSMFRYPNYPASGCNQHSMM